MYIRRRVPSATGEHRREASGSHGLGGSEARAALDRLVQRSRQLTPADAVELVNEARTDLADERPEIAAVTVQLPRRHATDSAYVRLAQRLDTTLWTLDAALARNAADTGLPVRLVA